MAIEGNGIPIIGETRTWRRLQFVTQAIVKRPDVIVPGQKQHVVGYQLGFVALRSDGFPVQCLSVVELAKIQGDPVVMLLKIFKATLDSLESFRGCNCLPNVPCPMHTQQVPQGPPS